MLRVTVSNNLKRVPLIVEGSATVREVLDQAGVDYSRGSIHMNGGALTAAEINKTFDELGVQDTCFLSNVVKADNAR